MGMKMELGARCQPPEGWLPLRKTLAGLLYRWARPTVCHQRVLRHLAGVAGWMTANAIWRKNDRPGHDIWGNAYKVIVRGLLGPREVWEGECEDLTLLAARRAREAGVPLAAMRVVVCLLPDGKTGHAVLVVETENLSLVWDCRRPDRFRPFDHGNFNEFTWLMASQPGSPYWRQVNA